jgi:carotenoid cleavage dioxygenase-like enzyme
MLTGVAFQRSAENFQKAIPIFSNQFILTDLCLSTTTSPSLRSPILPSIATLINPASSILTILFRVLRTVLIVLISRLPTSKQRIKKISVANTAIYFHDGRALATCESGPPIRIQLPELGTVGWFNGNQAEGEMSPIGADSSKEGFGGKGPLSFMKEWTTGHPKIDPRTGEMLTIHCNFAPPYVHCSVVAPSKRPNDTVLNMPVPRVSGGKMMHDFGASFSHTVILDLALTLSPLNLLKGQPMVTYEPEKPSRFGIHPRREPTHVRWFETKGCCIFHTANTWDEHDASGRVVAVNMLACRLTSASVVYGPGNMLPPPTPKRKTASRRSATPPYSAKGDSKSPSTGNGSAKEEGPPPHMFSNPYTHANKGEHKEDEEGEEECRLYYYRFSLRHPNPTITHQYALSIIPFEFPTLNPAYEMSAAQFVYGCSTTADSFSAALGKAAKIDVLAKMDVHALLNRGHASPPQSITGSVDNRSLAEILHGKDEDESIQLFLLPPDHYAQEARFVSRTEPSSEDDGFLLFYVFDESQLDHEGECPPTSASELWILDAKTMKDVVAKITLPQRVPYGLHGNWFSEQQIQSQRAVQRFRKLPTAGSRGWTEGIRNRLLGLLG